jgi:hypothetical protein
VIEIGQQIFVVDYEEPRTVYVQRWRSL